MELNSPKVHFLENHISAPRGCCAPKFLHALENDQVLLAHPRPGTEAPLTTFFKGGSKIGLKCNKLALITSELGGVARRNRCDLQQLSSLSANVSGTDEDNDII